MPNPEAQLKPTIAYIGHKTCFIEKGVCSQESDYGLTYPEYRIATITNFEDRVEENKLETITLIHEFGHLLNVLDHYGMEKTIEMQQTDPAYDDTCLYGTGGTWYDRTTNIMEDIELCGGCRNRIINFINRYKF